MGPKQSDFAVHCAQGLLEVSRLWHSLYSFYMHPVQSSFRNHHAKRLVHLPPRRVFKKAFLALNMLRRGPAEQRGHGKDEALALQRRLLRGGVSYLLAETVLQVLELRNIPRLVGDFCFCFPYLWAPCQGGPRRGLPRYWLHGRRTFLMPEGPDVDVASIASRTCGLTRITCEGTKIVRAQGDLHMLLGDPAKNIRTLPPPNLPTSILSLYEITTI